MMTAIASFSGSGAPGLAHSAVDLRAVAAAVSRLPAAAQLGARHLQATKGRSGQRAPRSCAGRRPRREASQGGDEVVATAGTAPFVGSRHVLAEGGVVSKRRSVLRARLEHRQSALVMKDLDRRCVSTSALPAAVPASVRQGLRAHAAAVAARQDLPFAQPVQV